MPRAQFGPRKCQCQYYTSRLRRHQSTADPGYSRLLEIALTSDFVMSAILALSASHLAWKTQDSETEHIAFHHHGVALKGLHEAIGTFSKLNSEAILAASMLLSWQATEWYVDKHSVGLEGKR